MTKNIIEADASAVVEVKATFRKPVLVESRGVVAGKVCTITNPETIRKMWPPAASESFATLATTSKAGARRFFIVKNKEEWHAVLENEYNDYVARHTPPPPAGDSDE